MLRPLIAVIALSATVSLAPAGAQTPAPPAAQPPAGAPGQPGVVAPGTPVAPGAPGAPGTPGAPGAAGAAGAKAEAPPEPTSSRKVFRWVDKDGVIHYSDAPPQQQDAAPAARQGRQR